VVGIVDFVVQHDRELVSGGNELSTLTRVRAPYKRVVDGLDVHVAQEAFAGSFLGFAVVQPLLHVVAQKVALLPSKRR